MMKNTLSCFAVSLLFAILGTPAWAGDAHRHGEAQLSVVLEDERVSLTFVAEMADLIGFERAPMNTAEEVAIERLHRTLTNGAQLFIFPSRAGCEFHSVDSEGGDKDNHVKHDHDHHEQTEKDHLITVQLVWSCDAVKRLGIIDVALFETFPAIERIETVIFREAGQSGVILTSKSREIRIK